MKREQIKVGVRVRFKTHVDRYPWTLTDPGETGTIHEVDFPERVMVKMDKHHDGLDEWDNCIEFCYQADNLDELLEAEVIE